MTASVMDANDNEVIYISSDEEYDDEAAASAIAALDTEQAEAASTLTRVGTQEEKQQRSREKKARRKAERDAKAGVKEANQSSSDNSPRQAQQRLFNTIANVLGEPSLSSSLAVDMKLLKLLSRQSRDSQCPYSTDQLVAASEGDDGPIFHYFLDLPPQLRDNIYRFVIPTLGSSASPIKIRRPKDCPVEPALLRVNRQIRHETWPIHYMENKFIFPIKDFNARTYIMWCEASPLRLKANVRLRWSKSRTKHFSQDGPWGKLLHWLEHYYLGICHGITSQSKRQRSHQWQLGAEMFDLVNSLTYDHDMFWPQIKAILENVHAGITAANMIRD